MTEQEWEWKEEKDFEPKHIFECGQCFRWNLVKENLYRGVCSYGVLEVEKKKNGAIQIRGFVDGDLREVCRNYFDLDRDYGAFKEKLSKVDPYIRNSIEFGYGIRILNQDLWEMILSFIISANNNIPRIKGIIERMAKKYGTKFEWKKEEYALFPTPEQLKDVTVEEFRELGLGFRDIRVFETTQFMVHHPEFFEELQKEKSTQKIREKLLTLSGVGPKVADCIMLFSSLKRLDVFPIDVWVRRVMNDLYIKQPDETKVAKNQIEKLAREKYGDLARNCTTISILLEKRNIVKIGVNMGVTIIYGKAGSGKSTRIFQDIKEKLKTGKKIYLITPEQFSFTAERKLLEELETEAVIQAEVLTFQRMAYRLIKESKEQEKQTLSSSGKAMIIASILLDEKKNLKFLGKSNENIELIQKQFKEFKKHGVTVADLEKVWETEEDPYLKAKVKDILQIYQKYEKRIEKEYLDEDDFLSILLDQLDDYHEFDGSYFYLDEFAGFTKQEYWIIGKLMERAEEVTIAICTDRIKETDWDETDLFFENKKTVQRLLQLAQERKIEPITYWETSQSRFSSKELEHLSENIYAIPYQVYREPVENLSLFLANNAYTEIEHVAEEILTLVKEKHYRYQDIAIITKDLESYGSLCSVILQRYHIPFFIDEKRDLSQNILIKYLISILDVFSKNWSYEAVFSYIKMDFLELEDDEIYRLEEYALKWGIRGNKWYQGKWKLLKDQKDPEKILRARKIAIEPLAELKEKLVRKTTREISNNLYEFLLEQKIDQKIEAKRKELEEKGLLEIAKEYQNSWKILMELLDELVFLFGEEKIGLERYMQLLKVGLMNRSLGKIPVAQDQVTIGDVDRSKSHGVKAIFIIGLNDGVFPAVYQSEGFLDDTDREKLKDYQIELAKGTKERLYEDRFNLYKAFSIAEEKLHLSYVSSDLEGATLRPSIFVRKNQTYFSRIKRRK